MALGEKILIYKIKLRLHWRRQFHPSVKINNHCLHLYDLTHQLLRTTKQDKSPIAALCCHNTWCTCAVSCRPHTAAIGNIGSIYNSLSLDWKYDWLSVDIIFSLGIFYDMPKIKSGHAHGHFHTWNTALQTQTAVDAIDI